MKKFLRRFLKTAAALIGMLILFHLVENWRANRAWQGWKKEQEAKGTSFDSGTMAPLPVSDSENFAAVPMVAEAVAGKGWAGLPPPDELQKVLNEGNPGDWRVGRPADLDGLKSALKAESLNEVLKPYNQVLDALSDAAKRPKSRLLVDYQNPNEIPALVNFRLMARLLRLRALVRLQEGKGEAAFEDVLTCLRVIQHLEKEPHLITQLLRIAYVNLMLQPVWEGLQAHQWNDRQTVILQENLERIHLLKSWKRACEFERYYTFIEVEPLLHPSFSSWLKHPFPTYFQVSTKIGTMAMAIVLPRGWVIRNLISHDRNFVALYMDPIDISEHRVHIDQFQKALDTFVSERRTPYNFLAFLAVPNLAGGRVSRATTGVDHAIIACALERFHRSKGQYPVNLAQVEQSSSKRFPTDLFNGQPIIYRRNSNGTYTLYSVGWNGKDDGGTVVMDPKNPQQESIEQGDWVWSPTR
jgi:hypothetical protein